MVFWRELIICVRGDISRLDYVVRYNSIPTRNRETVSQHSYWVSMYAMLIHRMLKKAHPELPDVEHQILRAAIVHDIGECVTGDVVRTFKYATPEFKDAVDKAEMQMVDEYLPQQIKEIVADSEADLASTEGQYIKDVLKAADFLSLWMFMNREHNHGNAEILPFFRRACEDFGMMCNKYRDGTPYQKELSQLYHCFDVNAQLGIPNRKV